uniref:Uncharacterized protein n=1 Tax=Anguilla anguilla TaxID=7936 RepID=A0A0E9R6T8_ANGAN
MRKENIFTPLLKKRKSHRLQLRWYSHFLTLSSKMHTKLGRGMMYM